MTSFRREQRASGWGVALQANIYSNLARRKVATARRVSLAAYGLCWRSAKDVPASATLATGRLDGLSSSWTTGKRSSVPITGASSIVEGNEMYRCSTHN